MEEKKKTIGIRGLLAAAAVVLCLGSLAVSTKETKHKQLRFRENGEFKILQVADMHYADGKTTPCKDVLPSEMASCSDLNTTAFLHRMIRAEKPDLIVFTGDNIYASDATDAARSLDAAFSPAISSSIPWAAVLGNRDQESALSREGVMRHIVSLNHTLSQVNPTGVDDIDGFGNYNLEVHGVEGSGFEKKSVLNLYLLDSGDYSTVPSIYGYGWIKHSQQVWFRRTSMKLQKAYMSKPEAQEAPASGPAPGLVYFHIPLPEFASVDPSNYTGAKQDGISSAYVNLHFFSTMVEAGDVKAVFTGHDHLNDFCGEYTGIQLCYGGGFGYHAYGKAGWARRARVVQATLEKTDGASWGPLKSIKTWKRLDDQNLTAIDVQVLWSNSIAGKSNKFTVITIAIAVPIGGVMVFLFLICLLRRRGKKKCEVVKGKCGANELTTVESLQFDLATIQAATNDFSPENKLGEGGFGEVFQGTLPNGQQIAVKRLSQNSRQGDEEFKNEVLLVAKLQHKNLVRLLGFCLEGEEKLLAYEFVPNKSLDYFLFGAITKHINEFWSNDADPEKRGQLDWPLRYKIVFGIARGMLYLHEDSRLRIIHRDLKCSNILLDSEMNPKISDFGMARIFGIDQTRANTNKIVGTFGYMSPEYAMHGEFSVKSDVYSFGILLLEIICGKRNNFYHQLDGGEYLASYVWNQWRDGMPLGVLDSAIGDSYSRDEVLRCLHICLLCIQEDPAIRPTMATVVLVLSSNSITPPSPQHPAFFVQSRLQGVRIPMNELELEESTNRTMPLSINGMSVTELYPR